MLPGGVFSSVPATGNVGPEPFGIVAGACPSFTPCWFQQVLTEDSVKKTHKKYISIVFIQCIQFDILVITTIDMYGMPMFPGSVTHM